MLGIYNANLIDARGAVIVMPVALFFGGLMQIIVAVLEVFRGNVFGAVVFGTYGPFWVIYGVLLTLYITSIPLGAVRSALALDVVVIDVLAGDSRRLLRMRARRSAHPSMLTIHCLSSSTARPRDENMHCVLLLVTLSSCGWF